MKIPRRFGLILSILLSMFLLFSFFTLQTRKIDLSNHDAVRTVVIIGKLNHGDYWQNVQKGAEVAAKEFNVNVQYLAPENDENVTEQIQLIDQSLARGMDALVIASSDYQEATAEIEKVTQRKIPVIAIDSDVASPSVQSFIGTDNYQAGKVAGGKMVEIAGYSARIGIMSSVKGGGNELQKEKGLEDIVNQYPNTRIVDTEYCNSNQKMAGVLTKKMLSGPERIDGIVALDVISSVGVANEVKQLGLDGKVKIITFDSSQEELGLVQDGVIQATIIQNPFRMGYLGVKYAVDAINGVSIPKRLEMDTKIIDLENMFWPENEKLLFPFVN
jgi:ribose transport system substrate-binding protein